MLGVTINHKVKANLPIDVDIHAPVTKATIANFNELCSAVHVYRIQ